MGAIELQVFASLVVILGAAFVALICDFLKGHNEQLRESNIELRVRQEEREKWQHALDEAQLRAIEAIVDARVAAALAAASTPQPEAADESVVPWCTRNADPEPDTRESFEKARHARSARHRDRSQPLPATVAPQPGDAVSKENSQPMTEVVPADTTHVAELPPPIATRSSVSAQMAQYPHRMKYPATMPEALPLIAEPALEPHCPTLPVATSGLDSEHQLPELDAPIVRIRIVKDDELAPPELPWESPAPPPAKSPGPSSDSLRSAGPISLIETAPLVPHLRETRSNVVEMSVGAAGAELVVPGGFHEAPVLARLLEDEAPFCGLAIVISVVDYVRLIADQGKPATEQLMGSVSRLVLSLAREQDFACRMADDEFVLIFGRETGLAAQRRVQLVSERLWDFQLRSLSTASVIFSWGASESSIEPLIHAVEHAREQMLDGRRNRRALAAGAGLIHRHTAG